MKIAIITIATGKYYKHIETLKSSIDKYFLKDHNKTLYLFTDQTCTDSNILSHYIDDLPSPLTTLLRFKYILDIKPELLNFDLIYYIDADCKIVCEINNEIFPDMTSQLVVAQHPWQKYNSNSYETNPKSTACVIDSKNTHYFQACFFGGYTNDFIKMAEELDKNIRIDLKNNIIAKWRDESHINKYIIENPHKELTPSYCFPYNHVIHPWEGCNYVPKIIHYNCSTYPF